jgi:hypothetical protein
MPYPHRLRKQGHKQRKEASTNTMAQDEMPSQEEYRLLERAMTQKVLDRAASDPQWKPQLLDDPETAMSEIPEAKRLLEINERALSAWQDAEVVG